MSILKLSGLTRSFFLSFCGHQELSQTQTEAPDQLYLLVILVQTIEELYCDVCYNDFEVQVYNW